MTKQVVRYSVCDKCPTETEATVTDRFSLNGFKFEIDNCDEHSAELYGLIMAWGDLGRMTGEPSVLEQRRPVAQAIDVTPRATRVADAPEPEKTWSVPAKPKRTEDRPLTVVPSEPGLPMTAQHWRLDPHAEEQMERRGFDLPRVLMAADKPGWMVRSTRDPRLEERKRGNLTVIVDPAERRVITVYDHTKSDSEATAWAASDNQKAKA